MAKCECGATVKKPKHPAHLASGKHKAWMDAKVTVIPPLVVIEEVSKPSLDKDLQAIVDAVDKTPQQRAKSVRLAFGARGWPDEGHPGTVRDFMNQYKIPCL